jgi:hypothetical protein
MAAVLWGSGVSFGGVLAFLYADLIVLPLLDVYRRYYGWKIRLSPLCSATMVIAALYGRVVQLIGWILQSPCVRDGPSMNYTFWLNIAFGMFAIALFAVVRRYPMQHGHCEHHAHQAQARHH